MPAFGPVTLSAPGLLLPGPARGTTVVDPQGWRRQQVKRRLAELAAERADLVARLLRNVEDREAAEDELEQIDRG